MVVAHTGEDGFFLVSSEPFDMVVLDIMLPGRSGIEVLSAMRERALRLPVLVLTAKDAVEDRVRGLDAGADDYLVKAGDMVVRRANDEIREGAPLQAAKAK